MEPPEGAQRKSDGALESAGTVLCPLGLWEYFFEILEG